jgi:nitroreductase
MDFFEVLRGRRSIRAYAKRDVEARELAQILQAANDAPSAGNLQSYEIVLVKDSARKRGLVEAAGGQDFIAAAPVALVFCANPAGRRSGTGRAENGCTHSRTRQLPARTPC